MKSVKLKKILVATIVSSTALSIGGVKTYAEWRRAEDNSWSYMKENKSVKGWNQIDGSWYFFNEDGRMNTEWINDKGVWYFTDESGAMKTGWINDKETWYFTDESGAMKTGWINDKDTWYFTDESGAMKTGWINDKGTWYFTDESGAMKTGWVNDRGTWYFTDQSGAMQTGVIKVANMVYYLDNTGAMQTGVISINGVNYTFDTSGAAIGTLIPETNKIFNTENSFNNEQNINSTDIESNTENSSSSNSHHNNSSNNNDNNNGGNNNDSDESKNEWQLVWSDEFDGNELDQSKWEYQIGDGSAYTEAGWGNNEEQYYTDKNSRLENGNLIISAKEEKMGGKDYTSTRIRTAGKYAKTYGRIEAAITMPDIDGLWPAFWMLPEDNEVYGTWASGGEIDIMEARGRVPNMVDGTIHFGKPWPNNKSNGGHYTFPEGQDITQKHVYAVEWEPGEIRWYVDGNLYYTANNWFSQGADEPAPYPYPAPFDKDFHILLNLAVGGNYDGGVKPDTLETPAEMKVDYVRVYDLKNGDYPVHERPTVGTGELEGAREPLENGSYILDPTFKNIEDNTGKDISYNNWNLLTTMGGKASFDNTDGVKVNIENGGTQGYSIQLIDHIPVKTNKTYTLKFKAKAEGNRTITAQFGGGADRSWSKYSEINSVNLTNELKEYEYSFDMKEESDVHGRLELNLGGNTRDVYITDVEVTEEDTVVNPNASKEPLKDGNHIYNGKFNLGDECKEFWKFKGNGNFEINKNGEAQIKVNSIGNKDSVVLSQPGTNLLKNDSYKLSFTAKTDEAGVIDAIFTSLDSSKVYGEKSFDLTTDKKTYEYEFTMTEDITDQSALTKFLLGSINGNVYIDNVRLERLTNNNIDWDNVDSYPLKNGFFSAGLSNWNTLTWQSGSDASFQVQDGVATIDIKSLGTEVWNNMIFSDTINLTKGMKYLLEFDAWADDERDIMAQIENSSYTACLKETVNLGTDKKRFKYEFFMDSNDDTEQLKFLLGAMDNAKATRVYIDNVVLKVKDTPIKIAPSLIADTLDNKLGQDIIIDYVDGDAGWKDSIKSVNIDEESVSKDLYSVLDNSIMLSENCFKTAGSHKVSIKADGFTDTSVVQNIKESSGNLIVNGNFRNGLNSWGSYYNWSDDHSLPMDIVTTTGAAVQITVKGGVAQEEIDNDEHIWSHQFYQDGIELKGGKTYKLSFDAMSSVDRSIMVELGGAGLPGRVTEELTDEYETYEIELKPLEDLTLKLNYLLGNVDLKVPEGEHEVYFKNISIQEKK